MSGFCPRKLLGIGTGLFVLAMLAVPATSTTASVAVQPTIMVSAIDHRYIPENLQVATGARIVWTNNGTVPHTVTSDTGLWESVVLAPGETFTQAFESPGVYRYHCEFYRGAGMIGLINVAGAAAATRTVTPAAGTGTPTATPTGATTPTGTVTPGPAGTPTPTTPPLGPPVASPPPTVTPTPVRTVTPPFPRTLPATGDNSMVPWLALALAAGLLVAAGIAVRIAGRH